MERRSSRRGVIVAVAAVALLAGCLGGRPPAGPPGPVGQDRPGGGDRVAPASPRPQAAFPAPTGDSLPPEGGSESRDARSTPAPPQAAQGALLFGRMLAPASVVSNQGGKLATVAGAEVLRINASGVLSNNSGKLVSDAGASVVSNNGARVVSNNGSRLVSAVGAGSSGRTRSHRALAQASLDHVVLADAEVRLLDAALAPVLDAEGRPITARTDAAGFFRVDRELPDRTLVAEVSLPGGAGAIRTIVPRAQGQRVAHGDMIATLTTGYVLGRYVSGQPDPRATLERLSAEVEARTREVAAAALRSADADVVPGALTEASVVAAVERLRARDRALDRQLEDVRRLLIAAGQFDLGDGQDARRVRLIDVEAVVVAGDGQCYVQTVERLWRLAGDGKLYKVRDNRPASGHRLLDRDGALLIQVAGPYGPGGATAVGLLRADDPSSALPFARPALPDGWTAWPTRLPDGRTGWLGAPLSEVSSEQRWWVSASGGAAPTEEAIAGPFPRGLLALPRVGTDAQGRVYVCGRNATAGDDRQVWRFDPATRSASRLASKRDDGLAALTVDPRGNVLALGTGGALVAHLPDGSRVVLATAFRGDFDLESRAVQALAPDGSLYLMSRPDQSFQEAGLAVLYRLKDGELAIVAGMPAGVLAEPIDPNGLAFRRPAGVAIGARGDLYVADDLANAIYRVTTAGEVVPFAGNGEPGDSGDGGPATAARLSFPTRVVGAPDGSVYLIDKGGEAIRRIDPQGTIARVRVEADIRRFDDMLVGADGTLYLVGHMHANEAPAGAAARVSAYAQKPDGEVRPLVLDLAAGGARPTLALGPGGTLHMASGFALYRLDPGGAPTKLKEFPTRVVQDAAGSEIWLQAAGKEFYSNGLRHFAIDARGRFYLPQAAAILRWDPAADRVEILAGKGGAVFSGDAADESIGAAGYPAFGPNGDLYFSDLLRKQVRRIPAAML